MASAGGQAERIRELNAEAVREGRYVLLWVQASVRAECNHALEYAAWRANQLGQPLLAVFGLTAGYPSANLRHYAFLLEGLQDAQRALAGRGVRLVVRLGDPADVALALARDASLVVCDRGYMRHQRAWRERVAAEAGRLVVQVESDLVVPLEAASEKREHAAYTLRRKVQRQWDRFLKAPRTIELEHPSLAMEVDGLALDEPGAVLDGMEIDRSVPPISRLYEGGTAQAKRLFDDFLEHRFGGYAGVRGQPQEDRVSHMSKYLHYGHISPVYLALRVREACAADEDADSFLDELLVRRELNFNWVYHTPNYDEYGCLPEWARRTLEEHAEDERPYAYDLEQLEEARTHDPYWNAAMREMRYTGYMHNYMRMYWGKKILEWSPAPEEAYRRVIRLNDKYFVDGRDPNSYANIAWVFGQHDHPWQERPIYGTVRTMTAGGLERKAKPKEYVAKVDARVREATGEGGSS